MNPRAIDRNEKHGLLWLLCTKVNKKARFQTITNWSMEQIKLLLFYTAKYYWPIKATEAVLSLDSQLIEKFTSVQDTENNGTNKWNLGDVIDLINNGCMIVTVRKGSLLEMIYPPVGLSSCIDVTLETVEYSINHFHLKGRTVFDLLTVDFFKIKHKGKINIANIREGGPFALNSLLKKLMEYKRPSDGTITPFIAFSLIETDVNNLGVKSIVNLLLLNEFYKIDENGMGKIYNKLNEMPLTMVITDDEREFNKVTIEDCPQNKRNDPLCNFRRQIGYQPVYNSGLEAESKTLGLVLFVAIYATSFRCVTDLITPQQYVDELIKCINDIQSAEKLKNYCGLFNVNPYFGEFENIINNRYPVEEKKIRKLE